MKITLLDINKNMTDAWLKYFENEDVSIINSYFEDFMNDNQDVDAIVSPANSFGLMDGGYDKAIIDYFGNQLMNEVQKEILKQWYGEQPVGTSMSVPIKNKIVNGGGRYALLIHTPTMRTPEQIVDNRIIYQCMRTTLIEAIKQDVNHIVIPAFGGATGRVSYDEIAKKMYLAYKQIFNQPSELNWGYALYIFKSLK